MELLALGMAMSVVMVLGVITLSTHHRAGAATKATLTAAEMRSTTPPVRKTNPVSPILFGLVLVSLGVTLVAIRDRKPKAGCGERSGAPGIPGAGSGDFTGTPTLRSGERWFGPVEGSVDF